MDHVAHVSLSSAHCLPCHPADRPCPGAGARAGGDDSTTLSGLGCAACRLLRRSRHAEASAGGLPALSYFRAGKADALLIVCVPSDELPPRGDLLTSRALSGFPGAWLAVTKLREVGLLPAAIGSRSVALQRAAALRERRFPCDVIARWLDAEGYAAPNTEPGHWTRSDVLKLLREARSVQPPMLPDEPRGAPAALL